MCNLYSQNSGFMRLKNGKVEMLSEYGSIIRTIYSNNVPAIDVDFKEGSKLIVITLSNGNVILRNTQGSDIRTIYSGSDKAKRARFYGSGIMITLSSERTQYTKENGSVIRTF